MSSAIHIHDPERARRSGVAVLRSTPYRAGAREAGGWEGVIASRPPLSARHTRPAAAGPGLLDGSTYWRLNMGPDAIHEQQVAITVSGAAAERHRGPYSASELRTLRELNALRIEIDRRLRENLARIKAAAQVVPWILGEEARRRLAAQLGRG